MKLKDDVVVVTGGGRGIGRAIAVACAAEGARVVVVGRTRESLEEVARTVRGLAVVADVTREKDVERAARSIVEKFGRVDGLVNNAGQAASAPFVKTDRALWDLMLAVNATSAFLMSRALMPRLLKRRGRVVMVASSASKQGAAYIAAYAASKHAMLGLARSLAAEFGEKGLRVNAVCPGYVDTAMTERAVKNIVERTRRSEAEVRELLARKNPQGRMIRPEEVAAAVVPLLAAECAANGEAVDL